VTPWLGDHHGHPSYLLTITDEFEKQGLDPRASSLRTGILGAEPWTEQMRVEIEDRTDITRR